MEDRKIFKFTRLEDGPISYQKFTSIDVQSDTGVRMKYVKSKFHQTDKYVVSPFNKPISKILD